MIVIVVVMVPMIMAGMHDSVMMIVATAIRVADFGGGMRMGMSVTVAG